MKPIKLIISAFGPYPELMPEIDFAQFEENGLFLISGDTGAGKTTIFDAISFALYGKTSGTYKNTKNLRSEYAKENVESFVDFYFSHQGKNYNIKRYPSYEREIKKGAKKGSITTEPEKVIFYAEDGNTIEGIKNVETAVLELLHINDKQFKQIAMIAQGEFWNLLNAGTGERTDILRTIFMTKSYKDIEFVLKRRMNESERAKSDIEKSIIQYFGEATADELYEGREYLIELQENAKNSKNAWNIDEFLELLDKIILSDENWQEQTKEELTREEGILEQKNSEKAIAETNNGLVINYQKLLKEKEALSNKKTEIDKLVHNLERIKLATRMVNPSYLQWRGKLSEIELYGRKINEQNHKIEFDKEAEIKAGEVFEKALLKEENAKEYRQAVLDIDKDREKYELRENLKVNADKLKQEAAVFKNKYQEMMDNEKILSDEIMELNAVILSLDKKPVERIEIENFGKELSKVKDKIDNILEVLFINYENRKKTSEKALKNFEKARIEYERAREEKRGAERVLEDCRAGVLARDLKENEPCPVCGSVHHIKLAKMPEESMSEEELNSLREKEERLLKEKEDKLSLAEKEKNQFHLAEEVFKEAVKELFKRGKDLSLVDGDKGLEGEETEEIRKYVEEFKVLICEKITVNTADKKRIKEECDMLDKSKENLNTKNSRLESIRQEKEAAAKKLQDSELNIAKNQTELSSLLNLPYENLDIALKTRKEKEIAAQNIEAEIKTANEKLNVAKDNVTTDEAILKEMNESFCRIKGEERKLNEEFLRKLKENNFSEPEDFLIYVKNEEEIKEADDKINEYNQNVTANEAKLADAKVNAEGKAIVDIEVLNCEVNTQSNKVNILRERNSFIKSRIENNKLKKEKIHIQKKDLLKYTKEYNISSKLYKLVTGQTGNGKITLEQYIQARGFDKIIKAANRRLLPMTDNQYELFRQEGSVGKQSNTFLDLEVLDNYTGKRRPVGNLSGGESFKASLSLALGLSDTVSSDMGGVQMDALFIDEGFGTLDKKSIDNAMDILVNLSASSKLVGIISHREELVSEIKNQIFVEKKTKGSEIKFIV